MQPTNPNAQNDPIYMELSYVLYPDGPHLKET